jgi:two-component system C4-dicarboxylate transport sensor histidine kinase DctB
MRSRSQRELREYDAKMFRTEQLASLGIISANIAHELNQPLTVIQLLLQQVRRSLTKKTKDASAVKENIDDSLSELARAAEIVGRFRTFARQSAPGSIEKIDICKVAESLIKALSSGARKSVLKLSLKKPRKSVYVRATAADIEQLFFVLIQNSIQAANPKKKNHLNINISCRKNNILVDFHDNCGGVPEDLEGQIFEPFFTTKPRQEGTGLGLPILERIVNRYEGDVKFENRPGYGISFHISLPLSG